MAYTLKTMADLRTSLADKHDSGVLPTDSTTLAYWLRLLNAGMAYCADKLRLVKSTSLTTASGTIDLPDDFILVNRVVNASGLEIQQIGMDDSVGATGLVFWIKGNQTDGFTLNMPTANDGTYTVWYTFRPAEMVNTTDVCVIPDPEAVVYYAYSKLRMAETDPLDDADKSMGECERRLSEIIDQQQMNDRPLGFTLPSDGNQSWFQSL